MDNTVSGSVSDVFGNLQAWAAAPFSESMSVKGWALFTGLILCLTIFWVMILKDLKGDI